jgi:ubiquinone/menaquinone biosynthesis C-methylase UbiE
MFPERVKHESLKSEYLDPNSLQYKKLRLVDQYIPEGYSLLDIGAGTGEINKLEIPNFSEIYGIDTDQESLKICRDRFTSEKNVHIVESDLKNLGTLFQNNKFNCIICLDTLEHIKLNKCKIVHHIYKITKNIDFLSLPVPVSLKKLKYLLKSLLRICIHVPQWMDNDNQRSWF